ncbi:MAG: hypothetical protein A2391_00620 [Candidatus Brennerbacteria bacterium RIFOXYB1_FULL_41_13]|nr:MAG: hypothetical protein A2391_00620 [Candidatus Brennerbacteria bacterium RIFOXYB1_FULL_41_13]
MQEKLKQIFGKGKNFKLLPEEKQLIKSHLVLFARNNPLGKTNFLNLFFKPVFAASLITALLVGSTSALAETALPGMLLYPIKIRVNEQVKEFLSFSSDAKAGWNIKIAERRLTEAEKLAAKGGLSFEIKTEISSRLTENFERFEINVKKIEESKKNDKIVLEINSDFEAVLEAHENILSQFSVLESKQKQEIKDLIGDVGVSVKRVAEMRRVQETLIASSTGLDIEMAARDKQKTARSEVEEAVRLLSDNQAHFEIEAYFKAGERLGEANKKISEGDRVMSEGKFGEAFTKFQEAMRTAQNARLLTSSAAELELKIEGNGLELELELEKE